MCAAALLCFAAPARAQVAIRSAPSTQSPRVARSGRMNPPLAVGLGVLGLSYVPSAIVGFALAANDEERALPLALPVVGPVITMELLPAKPDGRWVFVAASAVQGAGLATMVVGLLLPDDASMPEKIGLRIDPVVTERGAGLAIGRAF